MCGSVNTIMRWLANNAVAGRTDFPFLAAWSTTSLPIERRRDAKHRLTNAWS